MSALSRPEFVEGDEDGQERDRQYEAGFHIASIRREVRVVHPVSAQQFEDDILDLKNQLSDKEKELKDLKKSLKVLEERNNDLEIQLKSKCDEVKNLKERISRLEDEKRNLREELSSVKLNLKNINEDVSKLSKSKEAQEGTNVELEKKLRKVTNSLKHVEEDLANTKDQNKQLKIEIQQVRKQQRYVQGAPLRLPLPANDQHDAMMMLAEMACRILNTMYQTVLPDEYAPMISYDISMMEKDIQSLPKTEEERREAINRWEALKENLNWTEDKTNILHILKGSRTSIEWSTRELDEQQLHKCTKFLHQENVLKGWLKFEHMTGLIDVWKSLN